MTGQEEELSEALAAAQNARYNTNVSVKDYGIIFDMRSGLNRLRSTLPNGSKDRLTPGVIIANLEAEMDKIKALGESPAK